jgi:hypothetical protein
MKKSYLDSHALISLTFLKNLPLQIHDIICKTDVEIKSSGRLAMLKFLDALVKCSIEGACVKGPSVRTTALNTISECLQILRLAVQYYGILGKLLLYLFSSYCIKYLFTLLLWDGCSWFE